MTELEIPDTGAIFTFGRSRFADNKPSHFFIKNDPVVLVACGDEHTAVICKNGRVFAFGSNDWGQLGLGHNKTAIKPSCIKALKPEIAKLVACGRAHSIVVTESKKVFTFGSNQDGQLGLGNVEMANLPTRLYCNSWKPTDEIAKIAAGSQHSALLLNNGNVYLWGSNAEGQLGMDNSKNKSIKVPTLLEFNEKIIDISCGYYHTIMLTDMGEVYVFGENENGKLGLTPNGNSYIWKPTKLNITAPIISIKCGGNHNFLLTQHKTAVTFGSNIYGELGVNKEITNITEPTDISYESIQEPILKISCGENHTAILTESLKVYTCGDTRYGKLCQDEGSTTNSIYVPKLIPRFDNYIITDVTCGGCHTIICAQKMTSENGTKTPTIEKTSLPPLQKIPLHKIDTDSKSSTNSELSNENVKDGSRPDSKIETSKSNDINDIYTAVAAVNSANRFKNKMGNNMTPVNISPIKIEDDSIMKQLPKSISDNIEKQMKELTNEEIKENCSETGNKLEITITSVDNESKTLEQCESMINASKDQMEILVTTTTEVVVENVESTFDGAATKVDEELKQSDLEASKLKTAAADTFDEIKKDVAQAVKKTDSMENLIKEIEENGMEDNKSVSATDTVSIKSHEKTPDAKSQDKKDDEEVIVSTKEEIITDYIKTNDVEKVEEDVTNGNRISKMFNTFRRKKIATAGRTINIMRKIHAEKHGNNQENSVQSKACVIL